jgi:hypothetical protein
VDNFCCLGVVILVEWLLLLLLLLLTLLKVRQIRTILGLQKMCQCVLHAIGP